MLSFQCLSVRDKRLDGNENGREKKNEEDPKKSLKITWSEEKKDVQKSRGRLVGSFVCSLLKIFL